MVEINVRSTTGTNTKRSAKILFSTTMMVITGVCYFNADNSFIYARVIVLARINRQVKYIQGK
jgi:hypothetical protein